MQEKNFGGNNINVQLGSHMIKCICFPTPGIYGVGKAAVHLPAFAVLSFMPKEATETICWVGKGIVYDTGGLSIKTKVSHAPLSHSLFPHTLSCPLTLPSLLHPPFSCSHSPPPPSLSVYESVPFLADGHVSPSHLPSPSLYLPPHFSPLSLSLYETVHGTILCRRACPE